jgi:uncharacterized protein (TIGR02145 family)
MMKAPVFLFPLILLFFTFQTLSAQNSDFLMDKRDGNIYLVAKFNDQWWMCQNLKFDAGEGSVCYEEDETNCMMKGRLYSWSTAYKACPEGYHLPTDEEWMKLESYIGMDKDDLDKTFNRNSGTVGKFLRLAGGLGFDADYAGMINEKGSSSYEELRSFFWTASEKDDTYGWLRIIEKTKDGVERQAYDKKQKYSVRCIKAAEPDNSEKEDRKGERREEGRERKPKQGEGGIL